MFKKIILLSLLGLLCFPIIVFCQEYAEAQSPAADEMFEAKVLEILEEKEITREDGTKSILQKIKLRGLEGKWEDREFIFDGTQIDVIAKNLYEKGDKVMVSYNKDIEGDDNFYVTDYVRRGKLYLLAAIFLAVILLVGRWRGARAILGLIFSFLIIMKFIIPKILEGGNPLSISLIYSFLIVLAATYLVYGFNKKSSVSILGMSAGIIIVGVLSVIFTSLCRLAGFAQEEALYIVDLTQGAINLQGLLLAGFVIGALGVLDDLAISQVSTVQELHKLNPDLPKREIYKRAMRVGVDHISSMVNTLFLAYAGASLPLLLLFSFKQPPFLTFGQVLNHEVIATEIVRTLVGSIGLALTVPITTFLAAHFYAKRKNQN